MREVLLHPVITSPGLGIENQPIDVRRFGRPHGEDKEGREGKELMYVIMAKYKDCEAEEVDSTDDKKESYFLRNEYQMAYGPDFKVWIEKKKE